MYLHISGNPARLLRELKTLLRDQRGSTATEYGILVSFLALALVLGVTAFGQALNLHYLSLTAAVRTALGIP